MRPRAHVRLMLGLMTVLLAAQVGQAPSPAYAAEPLPPYWIALSAGGAALDAGPTAKPSAPPDPLATVAPGVTVQLRAKIVGDRRAYIMWPDTYANVGPNTVVEYHNWDGMKFTVHTVDGAIFGTGEWTKTAEQYNWTRPGQGVFNKLTPDGEKVTWTAPPQAGTYAFTVTGSLKWHYRRQAAGGVVEKDEESGEVSASFNIAVGGAVPEDSATGPQMTQQEALQHILGRFNDLGTGLVEGSAPTYFISPGTINNFYSVFTSTHDGYACGGWQGTVLDMLNDMRMGNNPTEKAIFDHWDYGPIQAYYGGHQAVVIYPEGTDWVMTGTVLDPWPNQRPETFTMTEWESFPRLGVGPSGVYEGQYPLTGGADYPQPTVQLTPAQRELVRRLPADKKQELRAIPMGEGRIAYLNSLSPEEKATTAVAVHSPVKMLITDGAGRRIGWVDEATFVYEIPEADVNLFPEADGTHGMVALLPLATYQVVLTAQQPGTFTFTRAFPEFVSANKLVHHENVAVAAGDRFFLSLTPALPDASMVKHDGTILSLTNAFEAAAPTPVLTTPAKPTTPTTPTTPPPPAPPATPPTPPTPPTPTAPTDAPTITSPRPGDGVPPRAEVYGTAPPGSMIVVYTEVRAQDDDELLKNVPGLRHKVPEDGNWHVAVACPELAENIAEPLYYVIRAYWTTPTHKSGEASVKVFRAE